MYNLSYENEFNLQVNEISFSYEKTGTKTRFEGEAKANSEMAYWWYIRDFKQTTTATKTPANKRFINGQNNGCART